MTSTLSCVGAMRVSEEEYQATPPPTPHSRSIPLSDGVPMIHANNKVPNL